MFRNLLDGVRELFIFVFWVNLSFRIFRFCFVRINGIIINCLMLYCVYLEIIKLNYFCEFRNYIIIFINNVNSFNLFM